MYNLTYLGSEALVEASVREIVKGLCSFTRRIIIKKELKWFTQTIKNY